MLNKIVSLLIRPFTLGIALTLFFTVLSMKYFERKDQMLDDDPLVRVFDTMAHQTHNFRLKARGSLPPEDSPIAILSVDEESLEKIGHWPWPRNVLASTVEALFAYQAKSLAFDAIFSEEDQKSAISSLQRVRQKSQLNGEIHPELDRIINQEIMRENTDEIFARSVARFSPKLIMGSYFEETKPHLEAYRDLCFNVVYESSPEYNYWKHQSLPIVHTDESEARLPAPWSMVLKDQIFPILHQEALRSWREQSPGNEKKFQKILTFFEPYGLNDESMTEFIIQYWIDLQDQQIKGILDIMDEERSTDIFYGLQDELPRVFDRADRVSIRTFFTNRKLNYCLASFWTDQDPATNAFEDALDGIDEDNPELAGKSAAEIQNSYKSALLVNPIATPGRWWTNISSLARGTTNTGFFNAKLDSDGVIRKARLVVRSGAHYVPSISFLSYLVANNYSARILIQPDNLYDPPRFKHVHGIEIWDSKTELVTTIPVDKFGDLWINYAGPDRSFPYLSVAELLSPDTQATIEQRVWDEDSQEWRIQLSRVDKMAFIKDKYFILGATAVGLYDLRSTPFNENYPGVETHANVLDNLLGEKFLKSHPEEKKYMMIFLLVGGILLSGAIAYFSALNGLIATAAILTGVLWLDFSFIFQRGYLVSSFLPVLSFAGIFFSLTSYKYFTEERQKKELKGTFQKYVSPAIVNEVLKDPSNLSLGGRKQNMTVFFSDIRGFTTISERLDPQALAELLNNYLTPMTEIVFNNKGTLDKYMGDAVMAFFGAPIAYKEHAECACRCALQQIEKTKELQKIYESQGLPQIHVGIGLNTGEMSVGNMGSETVRNYTVMGDAVNLGARLEAINKEYGTKIIISEFTQAAVGDKFWTREVDRVRVKGKEKPVRIFELISESAPEQSRQDMLVCFKTGYTLYMKKEFSDARQSFLKGLEFVPEDPVCKLYMTRCDAFLASPPGDNWDGVYVMTTK